MQSFTRVKICKFFNNSKIERFQTKFSDTMVPSVMQGVYTCGSCVKRYALGLARGEAPQIRWNFVWSLLTLAISQNPSMLGCSRGERNSQYGKIWIKNPFTHECTRIHKNSPALSKLLEEGWELGRNMSYKYLKNIK